MLKICHFAHTTQLTLNRPQRGNALNLVLLQALEKALIESAQAPRPFLIIQGEGKHFCTGMDLDDAQTSATHHIKILTTLQSVLHALYHHPSTTIVYTHGCAFGGALGLIAAADWTIAHPNARFRCPETHIGLLPTVISPYLSAAIGHRLSKHLILGGKAFDTSTAIAYQLIDESCDPPISKDPLPSIEHLQHLLPTFRTQLHAQVRPPVQPNLIDRATIEAHWPTILRQLDQVLEKKPTPHLCD